VAANSGPAILRLLAVDRDTPVHTTFSRRSLSLPNRTALSQNRGPVHVVIDATGLKVYGAGEWQDEKHGLKPRRTWRKLHVGVDPDSGEILACELTPKDVGDSSQLGRLLDQVPGALASVTADGAYDGAPAYQAVAEREPTAAVIIPPRSTAVPSPTAAPTQRDQHLATIAKHGRLGWQRACHYGRRSLAETTMYRYKVLIGRSLHARTLSAQRAEARIACLVLNRMTRLGMPASRRAA
jgi:transposase